MKSRRKITPQTINYEVRTVTPEEAAELLGSNQVNRRIRKRHVEAYAEDMAAGRWRMTGEPIKVSRTGRLLDGQHRLSAIIEAGVPVELLFVTGLADDDQMFMDQGASRTASDTIKMMGITNAAWSTSIARWVHLAPVPGPNLQSDLKHKVSTATIVQTIEDHPEVETAAHMYNMMKNHIPGSPTALAYCWYVFHHIDPEATSEFFRGMIEMDFVALNDPRKAVLRALRNVTADPKYGSTERGTIVVSVLTRAWNLWRKGGEIQTLRIHDGKGKLIAPEEPE